MADQVDAHPQFQVEDESSIYESWTEWGLESIVDFMPEFGKKCNIWLTGDDVAVKKKIEQSQKPSIWEYNSKGGVPTELANLNPSTFLTSRQGRILCFLPKDILIRICSMLSPGNFIRLSLTCRFLHWRMFTFCTCYAPYTAEMRIEDMHFDDDFSKDSSIFYYEEDNSGFDIENERVLSCDQPFCLRKPFFFDTLELTLTLPFYRKKYYDMCLPNIMAVRGLARNLIVYIENSTYYLNRTTRILNFSDTNNFFATINATYYHRFAYSYGRVSDDACSITDNTNIYINCPYARQMDRVMTDNLRYRLNVPIFQNRIGFYFKPLDSAIIATLRNFLAGSKNLVLHRYCKIKKINDRFPLLEYLFQEFGEFEEFFYAQCPRQTYYEFFYDCHFWKKIVTTENGEQLRIEIKMPIDGDRRYSMLTSVTIGKEEMFDEMVNKYIDYPNPNWMKKVPRNSMLWKMETAVEPGDVEELHRAVESNENEESNEAEESNENDGSDEAEKEQRDIFCCLNNNSCTIQ